MVNERREKAVRGGNLAKQIISFLYLRGDVEECASTVYVVVR
jgi:hypothetical protein